MYLAFMVVSLFFGVITMDFSWDGNMYHQEIIAWLMNGWNPFSIAEITPNHTLWTNHYAKALETVSATICTTFNNIEIGKAVNYVLLFSSGLLAYYCVDNRFHNLKLWQRLAIALVITCNPVVISQVFTFYIDFAKYIYLLWTLFLIYKISTTERSTQESLLLVGIIILAIGTKFNIFFEQGLWLILAIAWLWIKGYRKASKRITLISLLGLVLGLACSYHPYVTNTILAGNPLYPLLGENSVDIMSPNTPDVYGNSRIINFFQSIFAIEIPRQDARIGGFGPFAGIMLILSLYIALRLRKTVNSSYFYILICTFASCFIFEQSWWARYIAQLWLIPSIALFIGLQYKQSKLAAKILLACMLVNTPICCVRSLVSVGVIYLNRDAIHTPLENDSVMLINSRLQFEHHLKKHNVHFTKADSVPEHFKGDIVYYFGSSDAADYTHYPVLLLSTEQALKVKERMTENFLDYNVYKFSTIE